MICPCGSQKSYEACCAALIEGRKTAQTPEELMRSRYTAYTLAAGGYLVETTLEAHRREGDAALIEAHAAHTRWLKLEVLSCSEEGDAGTVEFKAYYRENEALHVHHEKSLFRRAGGRWYYDTGTLYDCKPGRNEQCPCGSLKKYKKCCGK